MVARVARTRASYCPGQSGDRSSHSKEARVFRASVVGLRRFCVLPRLRCNLRLMPNRELLRFAFRVRIDNLVIVLFLLSFSLVLAGCPKKDAPPNSRVATSERATEASPAVVPGAVVFNGEHARLHNRVAEIFGTYSQDRWIHCGDATG